MIRKEIWKLQRAKGHHLHFRSRALVQAGKVSNFLPNLICFLLKLFLTTCIVGWFIDFLLPEATVNTEFIITAATMKQIKILSSVFKVPCSRIYEMKWKPFPQCEASADFIGNPEDVFISGKNMNILKRTVLFSWSIISIIWIYKNFKFKSSNGTHFYLIIHLICSWISYFNFEI